MKLIHKLTRRARGLVVMLATVVLAASIVGVRPAEARWLKAESERFIVYSDGSESKLREFVRELEAFDRFLRLRMGLNVDQAPPRKLPIYLVGSSVGLARVRPGVPDSIAGFYMASDEDIFGIAIRDRETDTLKHEYAHHFMKQNFNYAYPAWFVEGFAEYFATVKFERDRIVMGLYNENRAYWLQAATWMPMAELLSNRPLQSARHRETYYPLAWLLTHWFMGDPDRQKMLTAYVRDVGAGGDPVEAMERATGLTPVQLRVSLRRYMNGRIPYSAYLTTFPPAPVTITPLPRSADDLLLLNQRLKVGVPNEQRADTAEEVRRAAARHPDDPLALLALGHAELHFGDPAAAEAPLKRLLELEPDNIEGRQYMARTQMEAAEKAQDIAEEDRLRGEAQRHLAHAYRLNDADYVTLLLLAENRAGANGYPNDNDVATLEQAYVLAPQLDTARFNLARILIHRDRKPEAATLLEPLVNDPHYSSEAARALLLQARGVTQAEADAEEAETLRKGDAEGGEATEKTASDQTAPDQAT